MARFRRLSPGAGSTWAARLRAIARARGGASALEFALVAPIFILLIIGILEVGVIFLAQISLQHAVNDAARLVRTTQTTSANTTAAQFRTAICQDISNVLACDGNLYVDVRSFSQFGSASFPSPVDSSGNIITTNVNNYQIGGSGTITLIRAIYTWPVLTPVITPALANVAGNKHLISATAAFRNEPS